MSYFTTLLHDPTCDILPTLKGGGFYRLRQRRYKYPSDKPLVVGLMPQSVLYFELRCGHDLKLHHMSYSHTPVLGGIYFGQHRNVSRFYWMAQIVR